MPPQPEQSSSLQAEKSRTVFGLWAILGAFVLVGFTVLEALTNLKGADGKIASSDVVAVIGTVTGVVGTLVSAYFGINSATAGKAQADKSAADAQQQAMETAKTAAQIVSSASQDLTTSAQKSIALSTLIPAEKLAEVKSILGLTN